MFLLLVLMFLFLNCIILSCSLFEGQIKTFSLVLVLVVIRLLDNPCVGTHMDQLLTIEIILDHGEIL
jgi:hypothetical protein